MFENILTVIFNLIDIISYCYLYSLKIGKFLVFLVSILLDICCILIENFFELMSVISDSFGFFVRDVLEVEQSVVRFFIGIWCTIIYAIYMCEKSLYNALEICLLAATSVCHFLECLISNVNNNVIQLCMLLKHITELFGSGVYFIVTIIPLTVWRVFVVFVDVCNNIPKHIAEIQAGSEQFVKERVATFYDFLTNVPFESVIGIIIAASLVYLFVQFYAIIFSYLIHQTSTSLYKIYYRVLRRQQSTERGQKYSRKDSGRDVSSPKDTDERYCVICQEEPKCILVLPCRHVCMCSECNSRLQTYSKTCPICRHAIDRTMKIFL